VKNIHLIVLYISFFIGVLNIFHVNTWKGGSCRKGYHDLDLNSKLYDFAILLIPSNLNRAQVPIFVPG